MLAVAVAALLPIVEIWLLVYVGRQIGLLPVLLLVLAGVVVGSWLLRRRWRQAWQSLRDPARSAGGVDPSTAESGRQPGRGVADGIVFAAGAFALMVPGLITDLVGLLCLIPFTRALPRRMLQGYVDRRVAEMSAMTGVSAMTGGGLGPRGAGYARPGYGSGDVIHGEVVEDEPSADTGSDPDRGSVAPLIIPAESDRDPRRG